MTSDVFSKVEDGLKPVWNNLSIEERTEVNAKARTFRKQKEVAKAIANGTFQGDYYPGANPYELDVERWLKDGILYHLKMCVVMGQRLKAFRGLDTHQQALENLFH